MDIKRTVFGCGAVAVVTVAVLLALVIPGGEPMVADETGAGEIMAVDAPGDVVVDVSSLAGQCTYWTALPPWEDSGLVGEMSNDREDVMGGGPMAQLHEHSGKWANVMIKDEAAISDSFACTDRAENGASPCAGLDPATAAACFLRGQHYIMLKIPDQAPPFDGCVSYNVWGLRGAAVSSSIDGVPQPFYYLSPGNDAVQTVCGLGDNRTLKLLLMACPDLNGDHTIDLFGDILPTAVAIWTSKGDPGWNHLADHNEDGYVGFFTDMFTVTYYYGLNCDDFDY